MLAVALTAVSALPAVLLVRLDVARATFEQTASWLRDGWRSDARNTDPVAGAIVATAPLVQPVCTEPPAKDVRAETLSTGAWPCLQYQQLDDARPVREAVAARERVYALLMISLDIVFRADAAGDAELERWFDRIAPRSAIVELAPRRSVGR